MLCEGSALHSVADLRAGPLLMPMPLLLCAYTNGRRTIVNYDASIVGARVQQGTC